MARAVAEALHAPLDVLVVRKVGVPFQPELAMGAVARGGGLLLRGDLIAEAGLSGAEVRAAVERERRAVEERERAYRTSRQAEPMAGRTVILVDDGVATGATMSAAVAVARQAGALEVVVAVPVAPAATCARLGREADRVVCVARPQVFFAVGQWYRDFHEVGDAEVARILEEAGRPPTP